MKRKRRPQASPLALGTLLDATLSGQTPAGTYVPLAVWKRAVGERVAARALPGKCVAGALTLNVASSAWATELSMIEELIRTRLSAEGVNVSKIRFKVTPFESFARTRVDRRAGGLAAGATVTRPGGNDSTRRQ